MCRIVEFKIANNWYNDDLENTRNIIMSFPGKYFNKTPDSFVVYPLGQNPSGMCSLVYVDNESSKIKMQFIINDSISASIDGELTEMNGKLFDEILRYRNFIILRGNGECAVYSAKTFKKLHSFSREVTIYQLPNGRLEFEEPDGHIYSMYQELKLGEKNVPYVMIMVKFITLQFIMLRVKKSRFLKVILVGL